MPENDERLLDQSRYEAGKRFLPLSTIFGIVMVAMLFYLGFAMSRKPWPFGVVGQFN